jgi:hypothetical protein
MNRFVFVPSSAILLAATLFSFGCGGSRQLQSVTISLATADARNSPNGQVQFTATGTFSKPPSPQPLAATDVVWCAGASNGLCVGNINPGISVSRNGLAECVPNFSGTATILAGKGTPSMNPDGGLQMKTFGAAQLTCP